jgi:hypothetical protein
MHYLIVIGLICLSSAALAQEPKQKSSPAKNAPSSVEIAADPESTSASYGDWALVCRRWRRSSEGGRIAFRDGLGRDIAVPMSFRGLAPALDALMKQN